MKIGISIHSYDATSTQKCQGDEDIAHDGEDAVQG
jgi:hypothetical protein